MPYGGRRRRSEWTMAASGSGGKQVLQGLREMHLNTTYMLVTKD